MLALQDRCFGHILNSWSDGNRVFRNESQSGPTFKAMQAAAEVNENIAAGVKHADQIARSRADMKKIMASINDPLLKTKPAP